MTLQMWVDLNGCSAQSADEIADTMQTLLDRNKLLEGVAVWLYNQGYQMGHHDTVEGMFTDVLDVDANTYHDDIVAELLADRAKLQEQDT